VGLRARLLNRVAGKAGKVVKKAGERAARSQTRLNLAERVTPRGATDPGGEQVPLGERETVQNWLRQMGPDETVLVHRTWGTIAARSHPDYPTGVFLSDGASAWYAVPPVTVEDLPLTKVEVEQIMLEAMTSDERPTWPRWVELA
jgi:hypothetical protein